MAAASTARNGCSSTKAPPSSRRRTPPSATAPILLTGTVGGLAYSPFRQTNGSGGMYVIMGGTGHVGSATAAALLGRGEAVTIVTRDAKRAEKWRARGAEIAEADVA